MVKVFTLSRQTSCRESLLHPFVEKQTASGAGSSADQYLMLPEISTSEQNLNIISLLKVTDLQTPYKQSWHHLAAGDSLDHRGFFQVCPKSLLFNFYYFFFFLDKRRMKYRITRVIKRFCFGLLEPDPPLRGSVEKKKIKNQLNKRLFREWSEGGFCSNLFFEMSKQKQKEKKDKALSETKWGNEILKSTTSAPASSPATVITTVFY